MFGFGKKGINELTEEELRHIQKELQLLNDAVVNGNQLLLNLNNLSIARKIEQQRKIWANITSFANILYSDEIKSLKLLRKFLGESEEVITDLREAKTSLAIVIRGAELVTPGVELHEQGGVLIRTCPNCKKATDYYPRNFCGWCGQRLVELTFRMRSKTRCDLCNNKVDNKSYQCTNCHATNYNCPVCKKALKYSQKICDTCNTQFLWT